MDVDSLRQRILAAASSIHPVAWSPGPLLLAATVGIALAIGVMTAVRFPRHDLSFRLQRAQPTEPRQLQFETTGGTRIIWELRPDLNF